MTACSRGGLQTTAGNIFQDRNPQSSMGSDHESSMGSDRVDGVRPHVDGVHTSMGSDQVPGFSSEKPG